MCAGTTRTHGHAGRAASSPEYEAWCGLKKRCFNPRTKAFADYGGRGITVCDRWRASFDAFLADMGPKPSPQHSIDRIDADGPYSPENCRWADRETQSKNKRNTVKVELAGASVVLADACKARGLNYQTVYTRIFELGWPVEKALAP